MRRNVKIFRAADKRVGRAAKAFIDECRIDTPRVWMGKKLFDLQMRLSKAVDARDELRK